MGNKAVFEWGASGFALQGASLDPDSTPKAQGECFILFLMT